MEQMWSYQMNVPVDAEQVKLAGGYQEEMSNVKTFLLSKPEFEYHFSQSGLFDAFNDAFHIIIMEGEEDRIESTDIQEALEIAAKLSKNAETIPEKEAFDKVVSALKFAKERGTFLEFDIIPNPKGGTHGE